MRVELKSEPFDPYREVVQHEAQTPALAGKFGATAVFVGALRDFNQGSDVSAMTLEHYPGMTARYLERIASEALSRWPVLDALVLHRHGALAPKDPIVLVAVWSAHRAAAFDACRFIVDALKTKAPFWKQESTPEGLRWVEPEEDRR